MSSYARSILSYQQGVFSEYSYFPGSDTASITPYLTADESSSVQHVIRSLCEKGPIALLQCLSNLHGLEDVEYSSSHPSCEAILNSRIGAEDLDNIDPRLRPTYRSFVQRSVTTLTNSWSAQKLQTLTLGQNVTMPSDTDILDVRVSLLASIEVENEEGFAWKPLAAADVRIPTTHTWANLLYPPPEDAVIQYKALEDELTKPDGDLLERLVAEAKSEVMKFSAGNPSAISNEAMTQFFHSVERDAQNKLSEIMVERYIEEGEVDEYGGVDFIFGEGVDRPLTSLYVTSEIGVDHKGKVALFLSYAFNGKTGADRVSATPKIISGPGTHFIWSVPLSLESS